MIPTPVQFKGVPGSPYTRKMLALLRYRQIPYELLIGDQATREGLPEPKVSLLPTFYLPNAAGEIEAVVDSTPLIRRFESAFDQRSVLPPDPVLNFVNYLLEDYGDEWLTKAMFHYRWYYDADIEMAGRILPLWANLDLTPERHERAANRIRERQISRLYVVGSNDVTAPVIEDSYKRFLGIMDELIQAQPFLMGDRPGSSDFAIYAQLTQLARFDPTPLAICVEQAPRVFAWTDVMDDLSGRRATDRDWLETEEIRNRLGDLLTEVGRTYVPALLANARALQAGNKDMETTIDGRRWEQPTFPYQAKCLQWIRAEYAGLGTKDQRYVAALLKDTGCEPLLA
ncbi:MAG: glutathione S-transferase N-terminal domain-containing protein [Pseudomonadota bacterium]